MTLTSLDDKDTVFADVSYHNARGDKNPNGLPVDESYPYRVLVFRSNDGSFVDPQFKHNMAAAIDMLHSGHLTTFGVYYVWRPDQSGLYTLLNNFKPYFDTWRKLALYRMFVMQDIESWKGQISGDHSKPINGERESLISRLNSLRLARYREPRWVSDRKRVVQYGNRSDLLTIRAHKSDAPIAFADYSGNTDFPNKIWHQFRNDATVPPWGSPVDLNSADGVKPRDFPALVGCPRVRKAA
jgi:hypothetical protein